MGARLGIRVDRGASLRPVLVDGWDAKGQSVEEGGFRYELL